LFKRFVATIAPVLWVIHKSVPYLQSANKQIEIPAQAALNHLVENSGIPDPIPVLLGSTVVGRQRYYVHLLNKKGSRVGFGKISWGPKGKELLRREKNALKRFALYDKFSVPTILKYADRPGFSYIITSPLTAEFSLRHSEKHPFPEEIHSSIAGTPGIVHVQKLRASEWFVNGLLAVSGGDAIRNYLLDLKSDFPVRVVNVHGDFGGENLFEDPLGRVVILDWEHFSTEAPYLTDWIGYWIGKNHAGFAASPKHTIADFWRAHLDKEKTDIALALIYLANCKIWQAQKIAEWWDH
jgi:hypothetical protein